MLSLFRMNSQQDYMQNQFQGPRVAATEGTFYYHRMKVAALCNVKLIYVPTLRNGHRTHTGTRICDLLAFIWKG